jgi:hypothetical protein
VEAVHPHAELRPVVLGRADHLMEAGIGRGVGH